MATIKITRHYVTIQAAADAIKDALSLGGVERATISQEADRERDSFVRAVRLDITLWTEDE